VQVLENIVAPHKKVSFNLECFMKGSDKQY